MGVGKTLCKVVAGLSVFSMLSVGSTFSMHQGIDKGMSYIETGANYHDWAKAGGDKKKIKDKKHRIFLKKDLADLIDETITDVGVSSVSESPDGRKVVFQALEGKNLEIFVAKKDTCVVENITNNPGFDSKPFWVGKDKIRFSSDRDGERKWYVMDSDGQDVTRLLNGKTEPLKYMLYWGLLEGLGMGLFFLYDKARKNKLFKYDLKGEKPIFFDKILQSSINHYKSSTARTFLTTAAASALFLDKAGLFPEYPLYTIMPALMIPGFTYSSYVLLSDARLYRIPVIKNLLKSRKAGVISMLRGGLKRDEKYEDQLQTLERFEEVYADKSSVQSSYAMAHLSGGKFDLAIDSYKKYLTGMERRDFRVPFIEHVFDNPGVRLILKKLTKKRPEDITLRMSYSGSYICQLNLADFIRESDATEEMNCSKGSELRVPEASFFYAEALDAIYSNRERLFGLMSRKDEKRLAEELSKTEEGNIDDMLRGKADRQWSEAVRKILEFRDIEFSQFGESKHLVGTLEDSEYFGNTLVLKLGEDRESLVGEEVMNGLIKDKIHNYNKLSNSREVILPTIMNISEDKVRVKIKEGEEIKSYVSVSKREQGKTLDHMIIEGDERSQGVIKDSVNFLAYLHQNVELKDVKKERGYKAYLRKNLSRSGLSEEEVKEVYRNIKPIMESYKGLERVYVTDLHSKNILLTEDNKILWLDNENERRGPATIDLAKLSLSTGKIDLSLCDDYINSMRRFGGVIEDEDRFKLAFLNAIIDVSFSLFYYNVSFAREDNIEETLSLAKEALYLIKKDYCEYYQKHKENYSALRRSINVIRSK